MSKPIEIMIHMVIECIASEEELTPNEMEFLKITCIQIKNTSYYKNRFKEYEDKV